MRKAPQGLDRVQQWCFAPHQLGEIMGGWGSSPTSATTSSWGLGQLPSSLQGSGFLEAPLDPPKGPKPGPSQHDTSLHVSVPSPSMVLPPA